jgi:hypothetical protein
VEPTFGELKRFVLLSLGNQEAHLLPIVACQRRSKKTMRRVNNRITTTSNQIMDACYSPRILDQMQEANGHWHANAEPTVELRLTVK